MKIILVKICEYVSFGDLGLLTLSTDLVYIEGTFNYSMLVLFS
jgi:hypothetical protein